MHILGKMAETLGTARADISTFAPRIITIKIPAEKIRERIGSGGKTIRSRRPQASGSPGRRVPQWSCLRGSS